MIISHNDAISRATVLEILRKHWGEMLNPVNLAIQEDINNIPDSKTVTVKQLEDMYISYEKSLWREHEDVRGDDMIEVGYAEQFLQDLLGEFGCWDEDMQNENI